MRRSRWMALAAILVVCVGMLGATAVTAGAQSSDEKPNATDVGITATEIHVAVIADVDNPIVPNLFKGSKDAVEGRGEVPQQQGGRRRPRRAQGRGRLLRLEAQRQRHHQRRDPGVRERRRRGRHVGGVAGVGRRDAQLQGLHRRDHGPARHPVRVHEPVAAVLRPVVPDGAAAGDLLHGDQHPQTFQPNVGPGLLLQAEVRQRPARRLHLRQRLEERA